MLGAITNTAVLIPILAFIFGGGTFFKLWLDRRRIRFEIEHQAVAGEYQVVVTIYNGGSKDEHLAKLKVAALGKLRGQWTERAWQSPTFTDLPARGKPVIHTFHLPSLWVAQRARFRIEAQISSRKRPFRSKKQNLDQAVINVLDVEP